MSGSQANLPSDSQVDWRKHERARLRRRRRKDARFKSYTIIALCIAGAFLVFFVADLVKRGAPALKQGEIRTTVTYTPEVLQDRNLAFPVAHREIVSHTRKRRVAIEATLVDVQIPVHYSEEVLEDPASAIKDVTLTDAEAFQLSFLLNEEERADPNKVEYTFKREHLLKMIGERGLDRIQENFRKSRKESAKRKGGEAKGAPTSKPDMQAGNGSGDAAAKSEDAPPSQPKKTGDGDGAAKVADKTQPAEKGVSYELAGKTVLEWLPGSGDLQVYMGERSYFDYDPKLQRSIDLLSGIDRLKKNFNAERFGDYYRYKEWVLLDSRVDQYLKGHNKLVLLTLIKKDDDKEESPKATFAGDKEKEKEDQAAIDEAVKVATRGGESLTDAEKKIPPEMLAKVDELAARIDQLYDEGVIEFKFNSRFFTNSDNPLPEAAGMKGAIVGSIYVLGLVFVFCLPVGVLTSIYLEEFASDNWLTRAIEVNINNLAAIPSIIFGVLGLAAFINIFGMPRGSVLVGAATLALMTLPIIIISTRAALRAVPDSVRMAGFAMGATRWQVVVHHVLPASISGIMTGSIIGIAQAMGETAPLIIIGLVGYVAATPVAPTDNTTVMPAQIFHWFDSSQTGFNERAALAILVLLAVLLVLNALALWIRAKSEKQW